MTGEDMVNYELQETGISESERDKEVNRRVSDDALEAFSEQPAGILQREYHIINETQARQAKMMWSFSEYVKDSETIEYRKKVDEIYTMGEQAVSQGADIGKVKYLCERFSRQYAEWKNKNFSIELQCPSVMISGGSNFPERKKEKQNAARDRHFKLYNKIMSVKDELQTITNGSDIIKAGDEDAAERLEAKLDNLQQSHETMKAANAYYRKNKTLGGFEGLAVETARKLTEDISRYNWGSPFSSYALRNSLQNINSVKQRLESLKKTKAAGNTETENKFFKVIENTGIMRLQLIFDGKPSEEIRNILKSSGYKWSPANGAWQRQLTDNARYSVKRVLESIEKI
jgi:hypothetical protein